MRSVLVTVQVALALVLLIGAGLMINSFIRVQRNDLGADPRNVLTFDFRFAQTDAIKPYARYRGLGLWDVSPLPALTFDRIVERMKSVPGVTSVAAINRPPLNSTGIVMPFLIEGRPAPPPAPAGAADGSSDSGQTASYFSVTPNFFGTMKIPIHRGRDFTSQDTAAGTLVIIINQTFARRFFPNEDPIGKTMVLGVNNFTGQIVGIVGDVKHVGLDAEVNEEVYAAYAQVPFWTDMNLIVKTSGDPASVAGPIRTEVANLDRNVPIGKVRTMEAVVAESVAQPRFRTLLLTLFGIVASLLATVGIYGVMSYAVTQRTHEIGIRMALGAQIGQVRRLIVGHGFILALIGVAGGVLGAFVLTRLLATLLFGVTPTDVRTYAAVSIGLIAAALIACYVPAHRAGKVDPLVALRAE
jgi:putative ABC transport system permease protein